jgi:hypothetical protein
LRRRELLFRLYQLWDRRNVEASTDPLRLVDCRECVAEIPVLEVEPVVNRFVHRFSPEDVARIHAFDLDVLVRFGFNILRGDILEAARYGVWSYHHGDNDCYRGGPAYFWELVEGNLFSGVVLQRLNEQLDAGRVLYKGVFATEPGLSLSRNRVRPYWGGSTFLIQKLRELHADGWERVTRDWSESTNYAGRKTIYTRPTNGEMLRWLVPALARKAVQRLNRKPIFRHWCLAVRSGRTPLPGECEAPDLRGFRRIASPLGRYYADPFVVEEGGRLWVFFEDYDYATEIGRISCAEITGGGIGPARPVLERPHHLSYPCVFRDAGRWYMIPESAASGTVELYRCDAFPDRWTLDRTLISRRAVDSTMWIENGNYWLFTTIQERKGGAGQLWLFRADSLSGEWTPHPANPISTDVRFARGGGAVFRHGGRLYRPSQDGSGRYGRRLFLNEILILNEDTYCERPVVVIEPGMLTGAAGIHTYAIVNGTEVIDCQIDLPARDVR